MEEAILEFIECMKVFGVRALTIFVVLMLGLIFAIVLKSK